MSMQGCIAIENEFAKLKELMEKDWADCSDEVMLIYVRKHIEETIAAAKSGWL